MANPVDIVDIVQVPALIKDDFIKTGNVVLDERGNPIHYTGGFAVVFPFLVNNKKWAFRCWYNNVGNIGKRLKILSDELNRIKLPYFCQFYYSEQGIIIDGGVKPTTRMLWVDGVNLKEYICLNSHNSEKLKDLAAKFLSMCRDLHKAKISHGDLQHGNIIIDHQDRIFLIDYDSMYVPALKGEKDIITGLAAYQHPARIQRKNIYAHEKLDYFSELIIYLSIIAISENSNLIELFDILDSDNLLFTKEDFANIETSKIYSQLRKLGVEVNNLLDILVSYLKTDSIDKLVSIDVLLQNSQPANYCINCGHKFEFIDDVFCIRCGMKRI